jgi:hypothetical protein
MTEGFVMSKFVCLYRGPVPPAADLTPSSPQSACEPGHMDGPCGLGAGGRLRAGRVRTSVADDGTNPAFGDVNGHSLVEEDGPAGMDAALAVLHGHPYLSEGKARFAIDVYELAPIAM